MILTSVIFALAQFGYAQEPAKETEEMMTAVRQFADHLIASGRDRSGFAQVYEAEVPASSERQDR